MNKPPRVSTAGRREALASAAGSIIAEKGIEGLRTRDVAERVGINIATLHYHVATKEDLVLLAAESACREFLARLRTGNGGATATVRLGAVLESYAAMVESGDGLIAVLAELDLVAAREPAIRAVLDGLRGRWLASLVNILAQGRRDGSVRWDLEPMATATVIAAALTGTGRSSTSALIRLICEEIGRLVAPAGMAARRSA